MENTVKICFEKKKQARLFSETKTPFGIFFQQGQAKKRNRVLTKKHAAPYFAAACFFLFLHF
ncbi:hypothetical protein AB434_0024 [Heyndrickxia coagulans]|uniref:Uncharacterized protein n=1 Tax=Heyndrickxia coagulans TaxID=1398 RepID=A0AAN0T360_HEYCO|nr:hypothetical protein SB48_HM08orf01790 [Heyndrickxia coagulans]KGT37765.1 hypothetical protein P421_13625 [Heyndrickxia coagulans P38]AKN52429.1 hypothetical protein AB434_0024 [Heyndrickxia coagulans]APB36926.1 hypothetical protein BIZ35_08915 [Heyndrickxia coagulans]KGB29099.1 hypothetical protein IE89_13270 [Heyndrickxia coagulans]